MPLECAFHLNTIAVIRVHKIWTNQQQDDLGCVEALTDLPFPFCPCANIAVMPDINQSLSLERSKIRLEFLQEEFIAPLFAGDYVEVIGRITRFGRTSRRMEFEARKVITTRRDISDSAADILDPPVVVGRAIGTTVVKAEHQRKIRTVE